MAAARRALVFFPDEYAAAVLAELYAVHAADDVEPHGRDRYEAPLADAASDLHYRAVVVFLIINREASVQTNEP